MYSFSVCCCLLLISSASVRSLIISVLHHAHLRRPSYLPLLFSGTLCSVWHTFTFLPCVLLLFFPQLFVKLPQITTLPSCVSFFWVWF